MISEFANRPLNIVITLTTIGMKEIAVVALLVAADIKSPSPIPHYPTNTMTRYILKKISGLWTKPQLQYGKSKIIRGTNKETGSSKMFLVAKYGLISYNWFACSLRKTGLSF